MPPSRQRIAVLCVAASPAACAAPPPPRIELVRRADTRAAAEDALREVTARTGDATPMVVDLRLELEPAREADCGLRLVGGATATLHGPSTRAERARVAGIAGTVAEEPPLSAEALAADPERAREAMRRVLDAIAGKIADRYPWR